MPTVKANGIDLYYEERGASDAPVILLIMGLGTQMIAWPDTLIDGLVARGFRVVNFDNRDVGKSTHLHGAPAGSPVWAMIASKLGLKVRTPYSLTDMANDAVVLMDALGIAKAHVVGASMGGMIAQLVAANHPDRVLTLTSIMSSSGEPGLPGPDSEVRKRLMAKRPANLTRETAIELATDMVTLISYPDPARDPNAIRDMAARAYDRGNNPVGFRRQMLAIITDGSRADRLAKIKAPTLVIHGRADRLVPLAGSEAIARRVPGARLEIIDEMAHDLPPSQVARMTELIAGHATAAE